MAKYSVRVVGLPELQKKLRHENLYAEPLRAAFAEAADVAKKEAERLAPRDTGRGVSRITVWVSPKPVPTGARVRLNVQNRGFRYMWALNASPRYHYRRGVFAGSPTAGWFEKARDRTAPRINAILTRAARDIERDWLR